MPDQQSDPDEVFDEEPEPDVLDEDEDDQDRIDIWRTPWNGDPWKRWPSGAEPVQELEILTIDADASDTSMVRNALIEIEPGVLPDAHWDPANHDEHFDLRFISRWNATWRGARLTELSLDMYSREWPAMARLVFDPTHPVDVLCAYHASYPGFWGISLVNQGTAERNARGRPLGHSVVCRDGRLAMRIAARYPGVASHAAFLQSPLWHPDEPESDDGRELITDLRAAAAWCEGEPVPGAHAAMNDDTLKAITRVICGEEEPPPALTDPYAGSLDSYTLIAGAGLQGLHEADLVRAAPGVVNGLAAHANFPDAIAALRRTDPDRLPLWLDFTDADGQPLRRRHANGIEQPLYGALITQEDSDNCPPYLAVILVGRTVALVEQPLPLCALGIGPDDTWRFPIPEKQIGLLSAYSGGVTVRHVSIEAQYEYAEPPVTGRELDHELARGVQRMTEWALARVGAVLSALEDGVLVLQRVTGSQHTYDLIRSALTPSRDRLRPLPDATIIARRLRELGSLHRVAAADGIDAAAAYEALESAGIDADQVLRDEILLRWRRTASLSAVVQATHVQADVVERYLREAGLDPADTPIPHDVTDPDVLDAVAAYRETGTLEAAGERLGISGETARRRIARAGLTTDEIQTEAEQRLAHEAVDAWERNGRSLAAAARELGIDPRTVKDRVRGAGVPLAELQDTNGHRRREAAALYELLGSRQAVAAVLGVSPKTVRSLLAENAAGEEPSATPANEASGPRPRRGGRPAASDAELQRAAMALAEHGSIRAAARALGMSTGGMAHRLRQARERGLVDDNDEARRGPGKEN